MASETCESLSRFYLFAEELLPRFSNTPNKTATVTTVDRKKRNKANAFLDLLLLLKINIKAGF